MSDAPPQDSAPVVETPPNVTEPVIEPVKPEEPKPEATPASSEPTPSEHAHPDPASVPPVENIAIAASTDGQPDAHVPQSPRPIDQLAVDAPDSLKSVVNVATEFPHETTVFVSDMSGFTRLTRKHGIIHYAGLILKMRQLFRPILKKYNALYVTTEADDVFAVFKSPLDGVKAAFECMHAVTEYNKTVKDIFQIQSSGIGLACGTSLILERGSGRLFGPPFEEAFHLGEDLTDEASVLVSGGLLKNLEQRGFFQENTDIKMRPVVEKVEKEEGEEDLKYFHLDGKLAAYSTPESLADYHKEPHPEEVNAELVFKRNSAPDDEQMTTLQDQCAAQFIKEYAVVMFGIKLGTVTAQNGTHAALRFKNQVLEAVEPILLRAGSIPFEECLHAFTSVKDAVNAVIEARKALQAANEKRSSDEPLKVSGFGVHVGQLLHISGTDVHWGDPVNTASKLGEDLAKKGEIYLSVDVMGRLGEPWFEATYKEEEISGAVMKYYSL